jgi:hypothetical protein
VPINFSGHDLTIGSSKYEQNRAVILVVVNPFFKIVSLCFQAVVPTSVCDALQYAEAAQKERAEYARQNSRCVPIID